MLAADQDYCAQVGRRHFGSYIALHRSATGSVWFAKRASVRCPVVLGVLGSVLERQAIPGELVGLAYPRLRFLLK